MNLATCRFPLSLGFVLLLVGFLRGQESPAQNEESLITLNGRDQRHVIWPKQPKQRIRIEQLIPGETYSFVVPQDPAFGTCQPTLRVADPTTPVLGYDSVARQLTFKATQRVMDFWIDYACSSPDYALPSHYVTLQCQTCVKKTLREYIESLAAVLQVQAGASAEELIRDVLIGGDCFDVANITPLGQGDQIGTFTNGQTNIGINTGVIIATGGIYIAPGPNNQDNASAGYGASTPDADLSTLTNGALFDRAGFEFDFRPTQSQLTFQFVFASEEYCEYVGSQYNDVFGFFIAGPGIPGGQQNIAVIPNTNIPITINNVNHQSYSAFYVNNQPATSSNLCGQQPATGPAVNEVQYDGFTRRFTATANLIPCETYRMKIKIADVGDGIFDSAVFLAANSFSAGGSVKAQWEVNGDPDVERAFEDCETVRIRFTRRGNLNAPMSVQYTIGGTATYGVDYTGLPLAAVIPAGQREVVYTVRIINDGILEGNETIVLTINNSCSCEQSQPTLVIVDLPVLKAKPDTVTICGQGVATVGVEAFDGVPPYTYQWQNGSTETSVTLFVGTSTNVRVTVTDACGKTKVVTARINVRPLPVAQLLPPAPVLCGPGQSAQIKVNFIGTGPFIFEYKINGVVQPTIYDVTENPFFITVNQPGLYQVHMVEDSMGCKGTGQGALQINLSTLALSGTVNNVQCATAANGSIQTSVTGGTGPYTYQWSGPVSIPPNTANPTNLPPGTYSVTVTDAAGCTRTRTFTIIAPNPLTPTIAGVTGTNCYNLNGGSIDLNVTGGFPNYTYQWSNGAKVQDPSGLSAGTYTVTVTDQSGCTNTASATVPGDLTPPTAAIAPPDVLTCARTTQTLNGNGSSVGANFTYQWTASGGGNIVSGANTLNPVVNRSGNYTLTVRNTTNGCTATATVQVTADQTPPVASAGPPQTITCAITSVTLDGTASSSGTNFTYQWTAGPGGNIVSGATTRTPLVSTPATYTLLVTNTQNGCTSTSSVVVGLNNTPPQVNITAAPPGILTCTNSRVTLHGSASPPGGNYSFQWTTLNGGFFSGQASPSAIVTEEGDYTLIVTNLQNGCTGSATIYVGLDFTDPAAIIVVNQQITCNNPTVTLDATQSSQGPQYSFYWTATAGGNIVSGHNTYTPVVDAPGSYSIIVTNLFNNCTASASVLVTADRTPPIVNAGEAGTLTCNQPQIQLGDPLTVVLPHITYQWSASPGGNIVSGANTPSVIVDKPGTYTLLVTNTQTGCTASASTVIAQDKTAPAAVVNAPGVINCTTPVLQLSGMGSSVGANFSYQWTTIGGHIAAGANTLTPTVTREGTYTLVVTNEANGCTNSASVNVTSNLTPPSVSINPPSLINCYQPQQTLKATVSGINNGITYQWGTQNGKILSGANTPQPVIGAGGTYTLVVTNTANGCSASASVTVNADLTPPVANAGQNQTLNCTNPNLNLNGSGSSQGANFSYQWSTLNGGNIVAGATTLTPQVNAPGVYQLLVTNTKNGCTSAASVEVFEDAAKPVVKIAQPDILSCYIAQVTLNAAGSSSGPNFTYNWSGPGIISGGTGLAPVVNQPGNYTLRVTNTQNGCTTTATVTVQRDIQPPTADAGPDDVLNCYFPQLVIGGNNTSTGPHFSYQWSGPGIISGANAPQAVVDQGGTYTLLVTNTKNGCTSSDVVQLAVDQTPPQVDAGPGFQLTCTETTYVLSPTASMGPNFTYQWSTTGGNFISPTNILRPTVNGAGLYYLVVTNTTNGCTATDVVQITQSAEFPDAVAGASQQLTCAIKSVTLDGTGSSTGPEFVYQWTPLNGGNIVSGANTLKPVVDQPGTYQLAVRNKVNSCVSYSSVVVTQNIEKPDIDAGLAKVLTCTLPTISLQGEVKNNGNFIYHWTTPDGNIVSGANTLTPSVNAVGTYVLSVTNLLNGCSASDTVKVLKDESAPFIKYVAPNVLTCVVKQVTIDATGTSTGNVNYNWSTTNGQFADLSNPLKPIVSRPGTYTLQVTNLDNGCTAVESIEVKEDVTPPVADAGAAQTLTCAVTTLQLNGTGSSQVGGPYFYEWTTPNGVILAGQNTLTPTVAAPGVYALLVLNIANGCSSTAQVSVTQDIQKPTVKIADAPTITCAVKQVPLDGSASSSGPGYAYAWSTTNGNIVGPSNVLVAQANAPGVYTLTVLNTINGCTNSASVQVPSNTLAPNATAGPPFTLTCSVLEVRLQAFASTGPQFIYQWTSAGGGNILSGANTLNPRVNRPGRYLLLVTNTQTGCTKSDETLVYQETNVPTDFLFQLKRPSCKDNDGIVAFQQVVGGYGPYLYSIDNGKTFRPENEFKNLTPGTYDLVIQDANGCEFHKKLVVPQAPDPGVDLVPEINLSLGDSTRLQAKLPSGYPLALVDTILWSPLEGLIFTGRDILSLLKPIAVPTRPTEYKVTVVSKDGCEASDRVLIRVDDEPHIYIPNAFSPWHEGENDVVFIFAKSNQVRQVNSFQIFDRWGTMVFQARNFPPNDPKYGWDGRFRGVLMNPAVFVYYAEIELIDGRRLLYKGDITLVR
ncbi:MAG: choice-of-anchor L domain-containing protein [Saprospiraceae bacterium]|nr:choice-of-anchor L domain-containing protein [Saprospiraceae bacterium]MDW8485236.1 choice-of-anchor L domain-containing protein [Saprospiraceae bacterium]